MCITPPCRRRVGHTLVEVLLALNVLGVALLAHAGAVTLLVEQGDAVRDEGRAIVAAGSFLDDARRRLSHSGLCGPASGPFAPTMHGQALAWHVRPVLGGLEAVVVLRYRRGRRPTVDTTTTHLRC